MKLFAAFIFITATAFFTFGQNASITGKVTFGNQTALHDADVQIVQLSRTTRTDDNGGYSFADVPAGRYTLLVHIEGFSDSTKTITVSSGSALTLDFQLEIAALKEQVTVTASGAEQSVFDSFQTVTSVGSTRIAEKASSSIGEVLENESGVAKRSFGPGSSRPLP